MLDKLLGMMGDKGNEKLNPIHIVKGDYLKSVFKEMDAEKDKSMNAIMRIMDDGAKSHKRNWSRVKKYLLSEGIIDSQDIVLSEKDGVIYIVTNE
jgi:hypothetical protein